MYFTFSDLKTRAKSDGYNLDDAPFKKCDWPKIKAWLAFSKGVNADYNDYALRIASKAPKSCDSDANFTFTESAVGETECLALALQAGLKYGQTETITIESNSTVLVLIDGKYVETNTIDVTYDQPVKTVYLQFVVPENGWYVNVSGDDFSITSSNNYVPPVVHAICGEFVCGECRVGA